MSKYHNKKIEYDGILFDSKKEMRYYIQLKELESAGEIHDLELQKEFTLQEKYRFKGKMIREIKYRCDFYYTDSNNVVHVVDVKGLKTDVYKLKKKLFEYKYRIAIEEV